MKCAGILFLILLLLPAWQSAQADTGGLDSVEVYNFAKDTPQASGTVRVVAFNIEFGSRLPAIEAYLKEQLSFPGAVVFLLSEADRGHSRSGDRHVVKELAESLGLNAMWGIEFIEYNDGTPGTTAATGNAILSNVPLRNARLVRHTVAFDWKNLGRLSNEERNGQRMALIADAVTGSGVVRVVSAHLESRASGAQRAAQMSEITAALGADSTPVLIGGDMNEQASGPLFKDVAAAGFENAFKGNRTRTGDCSAPKNRPPFCLVKIDWILYRGLKLTGSAVDSPVDASGNLMSDHAPVRADFELALPSAMDLH